MWNTKLETNKNQKEEQQKALQPRCCSGQQAATPAEEGEQKAKEGPEKQEGKQREEQKENKEEEKVKKDNIEREGEEVQHCSSTAELADLQQQLAASLVIATPSTPLVHLPAQAESDVAERGDAGDEHEDCGLCRAAAETASGEKEKGVKQQQCFSELLDISIGKAYFELENTVMQQQKAGREEAQHEQSRGVEQITAARKIAENVKPPRNKLSLINRAEPELIIKKKDKAERQLEEKLEHIKLVAKNLDKLSTSLKTTIAAPQEQQINPNKYIVVLSNLPLGLAAYRGLDLIEFTQGRIPRLEESSEQVECTKDLGICYCGCSKGDSTAKIVQLGSNTGLRKEITASQEIDTAAGGAQEDALESETEHTSQNKQVDASKNSSKQNLENRINEAGAWWRGIGVRPLPQLVSAAGESIGAEGIVWTVAIIIHNRQISALIDSGASRSFIAPDLANELQLERRVLGKGLVFQGINGGPFMLREYIKSLKWCVNNYECSWDFLVVPIPYRVILGADWLAAEVSRWDVRECKLHVGREGALKTIACSSQCEERSNRQKEKERECRGQEDKDAAKLAYQRMVDAVKGMGEEGADILVRPSPKHYKCYKNKAKLIPIKEMLRCAKQQQPGGANAAFVYPRLIEIDANPVQQGEEIESQALQAEQQRKQQMPAEELNNSEAIGGKSGERGNMQANLNMYSMHETKPEIQQSPKISNEDERQVTAALAIASKEESSPTYEQFDQWAQDKENVCPEIIKRVLKNYRRLFIDKLPPGLPPERVIDHTITLVPGKLPKKGAVYKLSRDEMEALRETISKLQAAKWITMTSSPFAAPAMMVGKKDDKEGNRQYRMVVNYKELNAMTISAEYPLPTIQEVLELLHGAKVFTTMDMEQGFHQIRMAEGDQFKTAFRTIMGQYEYKVMPFGLRGAPGTFQAVMNHMFFDYIGKGVMVYMDDLLVYSKDEESHAALLSEVLEILWKHKMYPKFSKCQFGARSIEYLGYNVSAEGIKPSKDKIMALEIWPEKLNNDTQVKQFLGTVNYCRMFMGPAFSDLARPLVELTKKSQSFEWTEEHTNSVRALKHQLINFTILQIPDPSKPYVLKTDASGYAVGGVLEQDEKPLGFLSRKMTSAEQRYPVYDQELLALISALQKWRTLLLQADVTAYTDHRALQYLLKIKGNKAARAREARWWDFLADFQGLKIVYKPGVHNVVADALSRCPYYQADAREENVNDKIEDDLEENCIRPAMGAIATVEEQSVPTKWSMSVGGEEWRLALEQCPEFGTVWGAINEEETKTIMFKGAWREFRKKGNLLLIKIRGIWRVCVPNERTCKQYVMWSVHDHPTAGHMGSRKTYMMLARQFYWPGMVLYSKAYVESCTRCRSAKSVTSKPNGLLQSLQIPNRRWAHVSLDFITGLPKSRNGNDAILTLVDTVSKMAHFIPTKTTVSAAETVELLADRLVRYHGFPTALISDRDTRFVSELWANFCERFKIKRALSSAWHPQTDGQTERVHRTLEQILRTYIQTDESAWEGLLPAAELAYNCTVHNSTGMTPFETMIGENPLRAVDLDLNETLEPTVTPPMTKIFQQLVDRAAVHILQAQALQKYYADQKRKEVEFQEGELVWVSTRFMPPRGSPKFQPRFIGPFKIIKRIGKVAYQLALPASMQQHPVFHVSLLQKDRPRDADMLPNENWEAVNLQPEPEYEVEYILDSRGAGKEEEFLVKWRGFPESSATWEPLSHLENSKDILRAFRSQRTRLRRRRR